MSKIYDPAFNSLSYIFSNGFQRTEVLVDNLLLIVSDFPFVNTGCCTLFYGGGVVSAIDVVTGGVTSCVVTSDAGVSPGVVTCCVVRSDAGVSPGVVTCCVVRSGAGVSPGVLTCCVVSSDAGVASGVVTRIVVDG